MRNARTRSRLGRTALAVILGGGPCLIGTGCHQHYYYYGANGAGSPCGPAPTMVTPSAAAVGPVCDVPSEVDGGTVVSSRTTTVDAGRKRSQVVVSEPSKGLASKFGWRSVNPEDVPVVTEVDGALDSTVK